MPEACRSYAKMGGLRLGRLQRITPGWHQPGGATDCDAQTEDDQSRPMCSGGSLMQAALTLTLGSLSARGRL